MTTTSTFTGLGEDAKPTSRVLKPPGGGSSNIFGGPEPAAAAPAKPRGTPARKPDSGIFAGASADSSDGKRSARDGDDSFNRLFGDTASSPAPQQKGTSAASQRADTHANLFGGSEPHTQPQNDSRRADTRANIFGSESQAQAASEGARARHGNTHDNLFGGTPDEGSYNILTGADYKDLAPNHHALHIKETPKAQKEQPPLPCSDSEYQAKEGKMQNVQTSTRVTNPPGGKTHKLW